MDPKANVAAVTATYLLMSLVACGSQPDSESDETPALMSAAVAISGWELQAEPQLVVGDALFELINGGAELYHRLGFVQALSAQYDGAEDRSISLEIFEMKDAEAAHSIFVEKSGGTGEALAIGDESAAESYYLNFRTGVFLVTITGFDSDTVTTQALQDLARAVDNKLGEST
jgi:hypothetical protein